MPEDNMGEKMESAENMENVERAEQNEIPSDSEEINSEAPPGGESAAGEGSGSEDGVFHVFHEAEPEKTSELDELKEQLAAARADLYNYRQRVERDRVKSRKLISEDKVAEFLPVLDNLDRALCVPEDVLAKDVLTGVRMVRRQFLSVLENSEVTVIPAEGCAFDPLLHDAVETEFVEAQEQDGMILQELMRGYRTPERVLRPAQVKVGRFQTR